MSNLLESSIVRIYRADSVVVGAGFLVRDRHILTCAHVVAGALGLSDDTPEKPQTQVYLDVPRVAPGQLLTSRVVLWRPPQADGGDDIAGLELESDLPHGAQPALLAQVENLWEHSFRAFGFPRGQDTGVWATGRLLGRQVTNWVQIEDVKEQGFAVEPGFSGTPIWDPQVEAVVGMVVAAEKRMNLKTAFAIPVDVLARSWPLLESLIHPFVFLCYARADSELVTRLKTDLLSQGVHVWIDREGLQPGTLDWEEALRIAIRSARAVLLIASPDARSSRYVRDELRIAEMYQHPVYPLWIAGAQWMDAVPLGWGGSQYIDARESRYETAILELIELLNKTSTTPTKALELDFEPRNPYKGLRAFSSEDTLDFFGRDTLIDALAATLKEALASEEKHQQCARLLTVVGPSGSGKSSVLMAGLLPYLREGKLPGSEQWVYLDPIVPGTRPIEALTLALSEHLPDKSLKTILEDLEDDAARGLYLLATKLAKRPGTKVVLLVDQFEELFTQTSSEDKRRHFLDLLVTATTELHSPVIVLLTLRADFYDRPMRYPLLYQLMQAHQTPVLPMSVHELREVIEKPAALSDVRLTFEGDLVGDLLFEVQEQVGALPLLQFTLDQLFQRRSGRQLTLSSYREIGGVRGALTRQAEETYVELPSEEHRRLARALFCRLVDVGDVDQEVTRRRAARSELVLPNTDETTRLKEVMDAFITARLLTTSAQDEVITIEVSHEAVLREWLRLTDWIRELGKDLRLQKVINEAATAWKRSGKSVDRLYRGEQLAEAQEWRARNIVNQDEADFLNESYAEQQRQEAALRKQLEQENQRRIQEEIAQKHRKWTRRTIVGGIGMGILAAAGGTVWVDQSQGLHLFSPKGTTLFTYLGHEAGIVFGVAWSLDGKRIASGSSDTRVDICDASDGSHVLKYTGHSKTVVAVAWSPDGKSIASASDDRTVQIWNPETGNTIKICSGHTGHVHSVVWSPDRKRLASGSNDSTVRLWDAITGTSLYTYHGHSSFVWNVRWSPNGTEIVSASSDNTVHIWNAITGKTRFIYRGHIDEVFGVAWSPDGKYIASGGRDTTVQVWSASTGIPLYIYRGHADNVDTVAWSPNGQRIASGGGHDDRSRSSRNDHTVQVWNSLNGDNVLIYDKHSDRVHSVAWSPDGTRIVSGGYDRTTQVWKAD